MNYKRTIRFQYYQIKSKKAKEEKAKYKIFDFAKWIEFMDTNKMIHIEIPFNDAKARIEEFKFHSSTNAWGLRLMKLRNTNVPSKAKNNEEAKIIELEDGEYLGEDIFLIYDQANGIALIQQNRLSLGISRLEEFFVSTYNKFVEEDEQIEVDIAPIVDLDGKKKIEKSRYKYLELSFANINEYAMNNEKTSLGSLLEPLKRLYGVNGSIKISLGHSKFDTLNRAAIQKIVKDINEPSNKRYVRTAKIKIQEEDDSDVELLDLFNDICSEFIEFIIDNKQGLDYFLAITNMSDKYKARKNELEKLINKK